MFNPVDLLQSAYSRSMAYPSMETPPVAPAVEEAPEDDAPDSSSTQVSISATGRQLAYASEPEAEATTPLAAEARARSLAYRPAPLPVSPDPEVSPAAAQAAPQARLETALAERMAAVQDRRIALYEMEKARGTPAGEIYAKLRAFNAAQPVPFK